MGIFSIFKRKVKGNAVVSDSARIKAIVDDAERHDYLRKASEEGQKARLAVKSGKLDKAWKHFHKQKSFYSRHSKIGNFTKKQALALDSQVHENMANILRLKKNNHDALTHILYWVIANSDDRIKRHDQKLKAYFNRCKFINTSLDEAVSYSKSKVSPPEISKAQSKVKEWIARG